MPPSDFNVFKNLHALTQQNYVVQARVIKQHNIAATLNIRLKDSTLSCNTGLFYSFVYRSLS